MSSVFVRISAATILLAVVGTSLVPYATGFVATSAVVNAPVVAVRAPFDGSIVTPSGDFATPVIAADQLIEMRNSINQFGQTLELRTTRDALVGEIKGIETQLQTYQDLTVSLTARKQAEISSRLAWFTFRLNEVAAQITLADATLVIATETHSRIARLSDRGLINIEELTDAQNDLAAAMGERATLQAVSERLIAERDVLAAAIGVDLISTNLEQINGRLDQVVMQTADLNARLLERRSLQLGLDNQIRALMAEANQQESFTPAASVDGLIWQASAKTGASVTAGETIMAVLDCSRRFLEVTLPERHFDEITTGTTAKVRLVGSLETFDAAVIAAYGSGARSNSDARAARTRIEATDGFLVIVSLDEVDVTDKDVAESFCDVGRTADVHFEFSNGSLISSVKETLERFFPWQNAEPSTNTEDLALRIGAN